MEIGTTMGSANAVLAKPLQQPLRGGIKKAKSVNNNFPDFPLKSVWAPSFENDKIEQGHRDDFKKKHARYCNRSFFYIL